MTKIELFLKLAKPNENGVSRWVSVDEFVGEFKELKLGNGGSWCRKSSALAKKYVVEFDKTQSTGNLIDAIRLNGFNENETFNQAISSEIKKYYKDKPCVMLGIIGTSENTKIEIDHKEGTKNSQRVSNISTQKLEDFQPLTKAANDAKRQICKRCQETDKRFDATCIKGFPMPYYRGNSSLKESGCIGCYQYDPVAYREELLRKARRKEI